MAVSVGQWQWQLWQLIGKHCSCSTFKLQLHLPLSAFTCLLPLLFSIFSLLSLLALLQTRRQWHWPWTYAQFSLVLSRSVSSRLATGYGAYDQCQWRKTNRSKAATATTIITTTTTNIPRNFHRCKQNLHGEFSVLPRFILGPFFVAGVRAEMLRVAMSYLLHLPVAVAATSACRCALWMPSVPSAVWTLQVNSITEKLAKA